LAIGTSSCTTCTGICTGQVGGAGNDGPGSFGSVDSDYCAYVTVPLPNFPEPWNFDEIPDCIGAIPPYNCPNSILTSLFDQSSTMWLRDPNTGYCNYYACDYIGSPCSDPTYVPCGGDE